jgi:hypothetical protein
MNHVQYGPPGSHGPTYGHQMQMKPELPQRDWRDYFVRSYTRSGRGAILTVSPDCVDHGRHFWGSHVRNGQLGQGKLNFPPHSHIC